jgi:hypothetical protein
MTVRAGIAWLSPDDAIHAIDAAKSAGVPILGFDAAFFHGGTTQPSLEDSWDYSSGAYPSVADPYAHAIQFIQERAEKGLRFEIVLAESSHR